MTPAVKAKTLFLCAVLSLLCPTSRASFLHHGHVKADLLSEVQSIQPGRPFWVILRLRPDKGWHTYWKNPGESGLPTKIRWTLPDGFQAGPFQWPSPERIVAPPVVSYGYEGEVFLLNRIVPPSNLRPGSTVVLNAKADWLECSNICVPDSVKLSLKLPVHSGFPAPNAAETKTFAEARSRLPLENSGWTVTADRTGQGIRVMATAPAWFQGEITEASFFPEDPHLINHSAAEKFQPTKNGFTIDLVESSASGPRPSSVKGVLVSASGWRGPGSEKAIEVEAPIQAGPGAQAFRSLLISIIFSFIGGMILNLMPCVFPVLSLKVLGFVEQVGGDRSESFKHGLIFTWGVLASFWTLAAALISFRAGGRQLGWGFQLQSPFFVMALSGLFFLIGLNLLGVFEVGTSLTQAGGALRGRQGWASSFLSGILATVVATPCTAPFMGSALGFALTQPPAGALAIFTSLGLGMSSPYLVLSGFPSLLAFVPRPGAWMETFKQAMGFLLLATVLWLLWVLGNQTGAAGVIIVLRSLWMFGVAAWIWGRWGNFLQSRGKRILSAHMSLALVIAGSAWAFSALSAAPASHGETMSVGEMSWEPYSPERVAELRRAGKPVFIDFSASWCLTCQVNERVALNQPAVAKKFKELDVTLLKGDWTSRDEKITQALQSYGRSGVPCYVLYGRDPNAPPTVLPEILTPGIVLKALEKL
jgi:thiol:disulfide interchange protein